MFIDIYSGRRDKYLAVETGTDIDTLVITDPDLREPTLINQNLEIHINSEILGMNAELAIREINAQGYHIFITLTQI